MSQNAQNHDGGGRIFNVDYLTLEGLKLGCKAGLVLSIIYAVVGILIFIAALIVEGISLPSILGISFSIAIHLIFGSIVFICLVAVMPAVFYGSLTGMILGRMVGVVKSRIPRYVFVILSIMVCILIAYLSYIFFGVHPVWSFESAPSSYSMGIYETYPFMIGFPTIIYIFTGGWLGWQLYSRMLKRPGMSES